MSKQGDKIEDPEKLLYKAAKQMVRDKNANAQWAGFCTSFGAAATATFIYGAQTNFGSNGPELLTYALGGSSIFSAGYTIQNALDLKGETAGQFAKGFIAPPLLAASFYMCAENIDWENTTTPTPQDPEKTLIIEQKPLSKDCWDREGVDHKLVCYGLKAIYDPDDDEEQPAPAEQQLEP